MCHTKQISMKQTLTYRIVRALMLSFLDEPMSPTSVHDDDDLFVGQRGGTLQSSMPCDSIGWSGGARESDDGNGTEKSRREKGGKERTLPGGEVLA